MRSPVGRKAAALAAAAATCAALAASCRTALPSRVSRPPQPAVPPPTLRLPELPSAGPALRIGILTEAKRVSVAAQTDVVVWTTASGRESQRTSVMRASFISVEAASGARARFRVQVASLSDEAAARVAAQRAQEVSGLAPSMRWNQETRTIQIRVGDFGTREEAKALASRLGQAGLGESWVVPEETATASGRMRFVETGELVAAATIVPSVDGDALVVDTAAYRGLIEIRPNDAGSLTVVNIVSIEDYLRGVIPNELSPQSFPQLEALKAQAVAARTYALRNRGQFLTRGYDICATPACQVYRGKSSEDPLSDKAVEDTRGVVAVSGGSFINALYTSTCGGHTEDASNIFEGDPNSAYLKGVVCAPERSAWATIRTAAAPNPLRDEPGLSRDTALLLALGVLETKATTPAALKGLATEAEVKGWIARLREVLGRQSGEVRVDPPLNRRGSFFHVLVDSVGWEERRRRMLAPLDSEYLLQIEDRPELNGEDERMATALLLQEGILTPFPDNTLRPGGGLIRGHAIGLMARAVERVGTSEVRSAEFRGAAAGELTVKQGDATEVYPLDPHLRLFRVFNGSRLAASEVTLAAGDQVSFVLREGKVLFLEAVQNRLGAAADRTSRYFRWEVRLTPEEVARSVAKYGSVGVVRDLLPRRLGVSGRVVELTVLGSQGEIVLTGLRIRWALGLRENLFVIERETDAAGRVRQFVFSGKGWGHGVGLCQVGAYGMALAGATYEEILKHYYTGIGLERAY